MKKIFLITKLRTTNIGNEALSHEIIKMFTQDVNDAVINVNGRPSGLEGYLPSKLFRSADPIATFERWTDKIADRIKKEPAKEFTSNNPKVELYFEMDRLKKVNWRKYFKGLKRLLFSTIIFTPKYLERARMMKAADWVVYSGAGEVNDQHGNIANSHVLLRQLIELRVAQKLGLKTAAINQSIFIITPFFKSLAVHVYSKLDRIILRGNASRNELIGFGVPAHLVTIAPDSAINTVTTIRKTNRPLSNKVGVNFPSLSKIGMEDKRKIINFLRSIGKEPVFATNEPFGDLPMIQELQRELNVEPLSPSSTYTEYTKKLAEMDFIISARVHTNILSMVSHTPVIPLETHDFRLAELMEEFEYPIPVISAKKEGWVEEVIRIAEQFHLDSSEIDNYYKSRFQITRKKALDNAIWLNEYS